MNEELVDILQQIVDAEYGGKLMIRRIENNGVDVPFSITISENTATINYHENMDADEWGELPEFTIHHYKVNGGPDITAYHTVYLLHEYNDCILVVEN